MKSVDDQVERWGVFELSADGPDTGNPFAEVIFGAVFKYDHREVRVRGFYDGDGTYRVRFMPDREGAWSFRTVCARQELDGLRGEFTCTPPSPDNHGVVRVNDIHHFAYDDGSPHFSVGTTCYAWVHQSEELQNATLATLKTAPFNKLRMCVFPKWYDYNRGEPEHFAFPGSPNAGWDFARFNPAFFRRLERRVLDLMRLGIEADIILFHPYDKWGFAKMGMERNVGYLRYLIARLASFRNVWWSLANEYDLMTDLTMNDWDELFRTVQENDPYGHLRSIHNCHAFYDHAKPWVTHCSVQRSDVGEQVDLCRRQYAKPVVVDECCYEGNAEHGWGNISGEEMARRFWEGVVRGGYVGHGETYVRPNDRLWWSKGGELVGTSPARIAFMRELVEDSVGAAFRERDPRKGKTQGLTPFSGECGGIKDRLYLFYFGLNRPSFREMTTPGEGQYAVEVIDTWNMTIRKLDRVVQGKFRVELPGEPYMALRLLRAD
ncbi:MAG: DUF5060 domain-containing protein [Planctomycetes bacterium]|nr:DUF5060 domain-containing protein [Planctomycetota bacterium]